MTNNEDTSKLANLLDKYINTMNPDHSFLKDYITRRMHRTLQQQMFEFFLQVIEEWSKQTNFDARNEYTIKKCKEIMKVIDIAWCPFI